MPRLLRIALHLLPSLLPLFACAQIPEIFPGTAYLDSIERLDHGDATHFRALYDDIVRRSSGFPDSLDEIYPLVSRAKHIAAELGHPYPLLALAAEQNMYARACTRLPEMQRDSALILFDSIGAALPHPATPLEAEARIMSFHNMATYCDYEKVSRDSVIRLYGAGVQVPNMSDSMRVVTNLYAAIQALHLGQDSLSRAFLIENFRLLEGLPHHHIIRARHYTFMAILHDQLSGDYDRVLELADIAADALDQMPYADEEHYTTIDEYRVKALKENKNWSRLLPLLDSLLLVSADRYARNPEENALDYRYQLLAAMQGYRAADSVAVVKDLVREANDLVEAFPDQTSDWSKSMMDGKIALYALAAGDSLTGRKYLDRYIDPNTQKHLRYINNKLLHAEVLFALASLRQEEGDLKGANELWPVAYEFIEFYQRQMNTTIKTQGAYRLDIAENNRTRDLAVADAEVAKASASTARNTLWGGLGAAALLLTVAGLAYRRVNRDRRIIASQKRAVDQSLEEKNILLREIHHRVKNNLQIISSMLNKQARISADPKLTKLVKEGKERIQSMAMVHQNLYESEDLSGVNIRSYLEELSANIDRGYAGKNVDIHLDVVDAVLDLDTAIPVGLILNELLTNSYKYAFPQDAAGRVDIEFTPVSGGEEYELRVKDNGIGLLDETKVQGGKTLGANLVRGLVQQLRGTVEWLRPAAGTEVLIRFQPAAV